MWMDPEMSTLKGSIEFGVMHIYIYICGTWRDGTDEPIFRAAMETQADKGHRLVGTVGEGEGGRN